MKYTYDPVADAVSITLKRGKVVETREVAPGVMIDLDKKGDVLYIELLDASKKFAASSLKKAFFAPTRYSKRDMRDFMLAK